MATVGPMKSITTWKKGATFEHVAGSAVPYVTDAVLPGAAEHERAGPTPMELLLGSMAGCSGVDLAGMLPKMRLTLLALRIAVEGERQEEHPRIFRRVHLLFEIETEPVDARRVLRAVELSSTRYCSATATIALAAEVTYTVRYAGEEYQGRVPQLATGGEERGDAPPAP